MAVTSSHTSIIIITTTELDELLYHVAKIPQNVRDNNNHDDDDTEKCASGASDGIVIIV